MPLAETIAFITSLLLFHSLMSKFWSLRAILGGHLHAIQLRELTGLHSRAMLEKHFGPHDGNYRFHVSTAQILAARPWQRWLTSNMAIELFLFLLMLGMVFGSIKASLPIILLTATYTLFTHVLAIVNFRKVRAEVEEEINHGEKMRMKKLFGDKADPYF